MKKQEISFSGTEKRTDTCPRNNYILLRGVTSYIATFLRSAAEGRVWCNLIVIEPLFRDSQGRRNMGR